MKKLSLSISLCVLLASPAAAVDLMGVYQLAQSHDAELRAAERRLDVAGQNPVQARSALLPQISGSASRTLGRSTPEVGGTTLPSSDIDQENYGIQLRQSLYSDANYGRLQRSRAELASADAEYQEAFQSFLLRVSQRYFDVLTALDNLTSARAEETALRRQFEQAEQRFEVGLSAITDVHEARAVYDGARARAIVSENRLQDAREALREVAGVYFDEYARLIEDIPMDPPNPMGSDLWVRMALESNPQVRRARSQRDAAQADLRVARAGHLPSLDLTATLSRSLNNEFVARDPQSQLPIGTLTLDTESWQAAVVLNIPIFQGFATQSRRRQAGFALRLVEEVGDQTERAVIRQTESAYRGVVAGIQEVQAIGQALVSAQSALEATNAGFEVGTRTIIDVLIAEQRFFSAQRDYSNVRHQFILNQLRLRQAAGLLDESDLRRVNQLLR